MEDLVYICDLNVMHIRMYTLHDYVILKCFLGHTAYISLESAQQRVTSPCPFYTQQITNYIKLCTFI